MRSYAVNIVDRDPRRRNAVARLIYDAGYHAEIFESLAEFLAMSATAGVVLLHDHAEATDLEHGLNALRAANGFFVTIVYTSDRAPDRIVLAMTRGAASVLPFPFEQTQLTATLEGVFDTASDQLDLELEKRRARLALERLTARERSVLELLVEGNSTKAIAANLGLSPFTVRLYRSSIYDKIGARNAADAARIFATAGEVAAIPRASRAQARLSSPVRREGGVAVPPDRIREVYSTLPSAPTPAAVSPGASR